MARFEPASARNLPKFGNLLDPSALDVFALHMGAFAARTINTPTTTTRTKGDSPMNTATLTPTTDLSTRPVLGRVRDVSIFQASMSQGGAPVQAADHHAPGFAPVAAAPTSAVPAYVTATRTDATSVAMNPWLGGFGLGDGTGMCSTTIGESTKRIHPGRLEGVT